MKTASARNTTMNVNRYINIGGYPMHSDSCIEPVRRNGGAATPNTGVQDPMWMGL